MLKSRSAFTLIEMMIVVAIISILAAVASTQWSSMTIKAKEGAAKGSLGSIRSALSIYYGDNEDLYPLDNLGCLLIGGKYIPAIPPNSLPPHHDSSSAVLAQISANDSGGWSYNNVQGHNWGSVVVNCTHSDTRGSVWSMY